MSGSAVRFRYAQSEPRRDERQDAQDGREDEGGLRPDCDPDLAPDQGCGEGNYPEAGGDEGIRQTAQMLGDSPCDEHIECGPENGGADAENNP